MFDSYLFIALLGITAGTIGLLLVQVLFEMGEVKKRKLQERLSGDVAQKFDHENAYAPISVAEQKTDSLTQALSQVSAFGTFNRKLQQVYPDVAMSRFMILTAGLALTAFVGIFMASGSFILGLVAAGLFVMFRFWVVNSKHAKRQRLLDDQLPDALEFLSRILRAGHSLATGLQMGGEELPEPLSLEFRRCYDQHSLGQPLDVGMREMAHRVATTDFAFFVTAVLIQRTTGGDLAEVLGNISNMIRARIRLQQHVKAITAEGRLVGSILMVLPFVFCAIMYVLNPTYAGVLFTTPQGNVICGVGIVLLILGFLSIRWIVSVKM